MTDLVVRRNPDTPRVLSRVRLFGVLGTWNEADVIAATLRHARTQGCERVYLVDNGSTDETVAIASREGAILARSYVTERFFESVRIGHMNDVVREVSTSEADEHLWWLFLDADEFTHGPFGMTLLDYLRTLDQQFRVVGVRYFDHYPNERPHYVCGRHPLDYQPLCWEMVLPMCASGHRKHPVQRYDKHAAPIECGPGLHQAHCREPLYEPAQPAFLHHFPFRDEGVTRTRLAALAAPDSKGTTRAWHEDIGILTRFENLDAVYSQRWERVVNFIALDPISEHLDPPPAPRGIELRPWTDLVAVEHQHVQRWY